MATVVFLLHAAYATMQVIILGENSAMKKTLKVFVAVIVMSFSTVLPAFAQEEADTAETQELLETTTLNAEAVETQTQDRSRGRDVRRKAYQEKAERLSEAQQRRVAGRCEAAQGKVTSLRARINNAVANRKKVYQEIGEKLDVLLARLQKAEMDTTTLETAREDMRVDLVALTESLDGYDTVLADLEAMDCTADPASFQAALKSAREMQTSLRAQAQDFRQFATTQLRAILQDIRAQLATKTETSTQPTESTEE